MDGRPSTVLVSLLLFMAGAATHGGKPRMGECNKDTSCKCTYSDGSVIDLSPLAKDDDTPFFLDIPDQTIGDAFSWNPCNPFTEGTCTAVSVCQVRKNMAPPLYYSCGNQDSATFLNDEQGRLTLQYSEDTVTQNGTNTLRTSVVVLTCDQSKEKDLIVLGERASTPFYDLELQSKYACAAPPVDPTEGPSVTVTLSISVGSILCITFVCLIVTYLIVGVVIQSVRKKTGKERMPNYAFWSSIPKHIKTGTMFTVTRGKVTRYDEI